MSDGCVTTSLLEVELEEGGRAAGPPVLLLHGPQALVPAASA
jgi:hypothetical protein